MLKPLTIFLLSLLAISYAKFDVGAAAAQGARDGLSVVGGWLILGVLIAFAFAFITRKKK